MMDKSEQKRSRRAGVRIQSGLHVAGYHVGNKQLSKLILELEFRVILVSDAVKE